ncbi:hypothetical protein [Ruegeria sp. HKCCA0370]|uniref:hypothetical protein n=1 Tax=Ruegeria sp. HKCCA0370 TaxID=2682995 RepID=UPI001489784D|nr:hypothetical protein [Ruegeria sp. HKCCA0370]
MEDDFSTSAFVNCPFDEDYEPILQAILFCLVRFGLSPRIATERIDSGEARLAKIEELIEASKYSIHDLSRCQSNAVGELYRLNMPFELGIDYGCRKYRGEPFKEKRILILEEQQFRYQAAISDLAGRDIQRHDGEYVTAIRAVRKWLVSSGEFEEVPASRVVSEYEDFQEWFLEKKLQDGYSEDDFKDMPTTELLAGMKEWANSGKPRQ